MSLSSAKRAWIVVAIFAVLICVIAVAGLAHYRSHSPRSGLAISVPIPGAAPNLLSELPPDAPSVGYADLDALRRLKDSPLAAFLGLTSSSPQADRDYKEFIRNTGFDYARDLDRLAIAFWPPPLGSSPAPSVNPSPGPSGEASDDNRLFAIALGRFDESKIKAYALRAGRSKQKGTHTIYEVPGDPPVSFEFLTPGKMAFASGRDAEALLWMPDSSSRDPGVQESINRVAGAPIFAVMNTDLLPPGFYSNFHNSPQLVHLVRSVKSLTFAGQPDGPNMELSLDGQCGSMTDATAIATLLDGFRMFGSMAFSDPKTRSQMTKEQAAFLQSVINQVKVSHQDIWVRLGLTVTPQMLGVTSPTQ